MTATAEYQPAKNNFWISFEVDDELTIMNDYSMTMRADSVEEAGTATPIYVLRDLDPAPQQGQPVPADLQPIVDARLHVEDVAFLEPRDRTVRRRREAEHARRIERDRMVRERPPRVRCYRNRC